MSARNQESMVSPVPAEVSVLVAAHRRPDTLKVALDSVFAQKNVRVEVIVVNDVAEPDLVDDVVRAYPPIVYLKDTRYNTLSIKHLVGLELAHAAYIHFLDDDDYVTDVNFFRKAVDKLNGDEKLALMSGSCDLRIEEGSHDAYRMENCPNEVLGVVDGAEMFQDLQTTRRKPMVVATVFRTSALVTGKPLVEASDSSLFLKALLVGDAYISPCTVAVYRVWQDSMTRGRGSTFDFKLNVMSQKESLLVQAKGRIRDPLEWWNLTFQMNYRFFKKSFASEEERISFLVWGLTHDNGSLELKAFILRELASNRRTDVASVDGRELRKRLQATEKAKGELWKRLQSAEKSKGELWQKLQAAEASKGELWQKLQAAEAAKAEQWRQKSAAEKARAELYVRLQEKEVRRRALEQVLERVAKVI